jgi:hypothetical protein
MENHITFTTDPIVRARAASQVALLTADPRFTMPTSRLSMLERRLTHLSGWGRYAARGWAKPAMGSPVGRNDLRGCRTGFTATNGAFSTRVGPPPLSISV